ncbi:hypothetical protein SAMN05216486_10475 [bacterium JGI 053]|nr:hypothetical protein SAMN05216486_10475 [bacterium JGI 053]
MSGRRDAGRAGGRASLLLGVNAFAATGDGARRQAEALESWRGLSGVRLANLGWPGDVVEVDGFATHPVLREDSRTASGRAGPRKPVVSEAFDRLAAIAAAEGCRWFGYANSDIAWTQDAVDAIVAGGRQAYAFSRCDVEPGTGRGMEIVTAGIDAFVVDVAWWGANRRRFRAYLGGEPIWDNVYAAVLLAHGDGVLLNRAPLVLHERHPAGDWGRSPYAGYLAYLAALDSLYFSRWAAYHHRLSELRARGAGEDEDEEAALQREAFRGRFPARDRLVQVGRALKARARWAAARRRSA